MRAVSRQVRSYNSIPIRRARPSDAATVARFNSAMGMETEGIVLDKRRLQRGVKAVLRDRTKGFYLVAEINRKVVGQMMITCEWSDWRSGFFWWIQSVYVLPSYRGRGVYRALHEHAVRLAKIRKDICGIRLYVDRYNRRAQKVYRKLGMKKARYVMFEEDFVLLRPI